MPLYRSVIGANTNSDGREYRLEISISQEELIDISHNNVHIFNITIHRRADRKG